MQPRRGIFAGAINPACRKHHARTSLPRYHCQVDCDQEPGSRNAEEVQGQAANEMHQGPETGDSRGREARLVPDSRGPFRPIRLSGRLTLNTVNQFPARVEDLHESGAGVNTKTPRVHIFAFRVSVDIVPEDTMRREVQFPCSIGQKLFIPGRAVKGPAVSPSADAPVDCMDDDRPVAGIQDSDLGQTRRVVDPDFELEMPCGAAVDEPVHATHDQRCRRRQRL